MEKNYIEDETFEKIVFDNKLLSGSDYENCVFLDCSFAGVNLSNIKFINCIFRHCNLSMALLGNTAFRTIQFNDCKLLGLRFDNCNAFLFEVSFDHCQLNLSSFYKLPLKKTVFNNSTLQEVDFTEAYLSEAIFNNCDLQKAIFEETVLEKTDFRTSFNYSINPESNRIKKARFSKEGITGLLDKYDIEIE